MIKKSLSQNKATNITLLWHFNWIMKYLCLIFDLQD